MSDLYECSECLQQLTEDDIAHVVVDLTDGWGHLCKDAPGTLCESYLSVVSEGEGQE